MLALIFQILHDGPVWAPWKCSSSPFSIACRRSLMSEITLTGLTNVYFWCTELWSDRLINSFFTSCFNFNQVHRLRKVVPHEPCLTLMTVGQTFPLTAVTRVTAKSQFHWCLKFTRCANRTSRAWCKRHWYFFPKRQYKKPINRYQHYCYILTESNCIQAIKFIFVVGATITHLYVYICVWMY